MAGDDNHVKCDVEEQLNGLNLRDITRFALSELRILNTGDENTSIVKLYMYPQRENSTEWMDYRVKSMEPTEKWTTTGGDDRTIISLHGDQKMSDKGLRVINPECWDDMIRFFKTLKVVDTIEIKKETLSHKTWTDSVKVIANIRLL